MLNKSFILEVRICYMDRIIKLKYIVLEKKFTLLWNPGSVYEHTGIYEL